MRNDNRTRCTNTLPDDPNVFPNGKTQGPDRRDQHIARTERSSELHITKYEKGDETMNVIIEIENPNEVQSDLIRLLAIQDEMKAAQRDQDETEKIQTVLNIVKKKIQEE